MIMLLTFICLLQNIAHEWSYFHIINTLYFTSSPFFYLYFHLYIVYKCTRKSTGENKAKQNIKRSIQAKRLCIGQCCTCAGEILPLYFMDLLSWRSYRWRIERLPKSSTLLRRDWSILCFVHKIPALTIMGF